MKAFLAIIGAIFAIALRGNAAQAGESVVLIYNQRVPESKAVADHYAKVRQVPTNQIIGLSLPTTQTMTRDEYNRDLQLPLSDYFEREKLWTSVYAEANGMPGRRVT